MSIAAGLAASLAVASQPLLPASCAVRETLWIEHYAAALYVPGHIPALKAVQSATMPKALQIRILNKTFLPSEMPKKWRKTLEQQLDAGTLERIRAAYKQLHAGDLVTLMYEPGPGVALKVNGEMVAASRSHALVEALLRDWADGDPVPERLARTLKRHPC